MNNLTLWPIDDIRPSSRRTADANAEALAWAHQYAYHALLDLRRAMFLQSCGETQRAETWADRAAAWQRDAGGVVHPDATDEERKWLEAVT